MDCVPQYIFMSPAPVQWPWGKLEKALGPVIKAHGGLPPKGKLEKLGRNDLILGIRRNGGFPAVRRRLGEKQLRHLGEKSPRHWEVARRRVEGLGFPSWDTLQRTDSGLAAAITRHHGGYVAVKRRCGERTAIGWGLNRWENLEPLLLKIMDDHGGDLPAINVIRDSEDPEYRAVYRAIYAHYSGIAEVRCRLGLKLKNYVGEASLRHRDNLDAILIPLVRRLGYFPSTEQLKKMKLGRVVHFFPHHGGAVAIGREYGYPPRQKSGPESLKIWENLKREIQEIIFLIGRFPTVTDLRKLKRKYVYNAISQHHGMRVVRGRFGVRPPYKRGIDSLRYWDNYLGELLRAVKVVGHFPSQKELQAIGRSDLIGAARQHGGLVTVRERFEAFMASATIRTEDIAVPKPSKEVLPGSVKLLDLLEFYGVEPQQIIDNIISDSSGAHLLVPAPYYSTIVEPVPLSTEEGVFSLDAENASIVSLFIQLSSTDPAQKREAIDKIERIADGGTELKVPALTLLRNAFMVENDKVIEREMDAVLEKRKFRDVWASL